MRKVWTVLIIIVLLVGGGSFWFFTRHKSATAQTLYPVTIVQKGTLTSSVSGSGDLKPDIDEDIMTGSTDTGKTIDTVDVSANDTVKKGDKILTFTDGTTLDAPHSGTITKVNVYDGDRTTAGRAVAHLTNYTDLDAVLQVDELDIPKIKDGQVASVVVNAYPNKAFSGKVTSIAKEGTDTNGVSTFDVTVHLTKNTGLKPGMTTTASIVIQKRTNVLYLPSGAVHQTGNQAYVTLSSKNTASQNDQNGYRRYSSMGLDQKQGRRVTVKTGIHSDQSIEITSGLTDGQAVQLTAITKGTGTTTSSTGQGQYRSMMQGANGGGQGVGGGQRFRMRTNGGGNGQ
ncbi:MAG: efflux RND transporter periplasmic adaptor subunit [Sporolactobacillus sp.]